MSEEPFDVQAARARCDAASPGPWRWAYPGSDSPELVGVGGDENYSYEVSVIEARHDGGCGCRKSCDLTVEMTAADAEFIAHARTDLPAALAEIERLWIVLADHAAPVSGEYLTKLHDRAHRQPNSRPWRIVDTLVHKLDSETLRGGEARAALSRVLDLCDEYRAHCDPETMQARVAEIFRAAAAEQVSS